MENDPDVVALVATSAALTLSGIPFRGPIGAARVGYVDGQYVLNPSIDQMKETLKKKQEGKCTCSDKDILCKTMCGTLLGPSAKDYK